MIRRTFLQMLLASPLAGLLKKKSEEKPPLLWCDAEGNSGVVSETIGTSDHFWMQTYGPYYNPDFDPDWGKADSRLIGIYSGPVLDGLKASEYLIGTRFMPADGSLYVCYSGNAAATGININGRGVYANGS